MFYVHVRQNDCTNVIQGYMFSYKSKILSFWSTFPVNSWIFYSGFNTASNSDSINEWMNVFFFCPQVCLLAVVVQSSQILGRRLLSSYSSMMTHAQHRWTTKFLEIGSRITSLLLCWFSSVNISTSLIVRGGGNFAVCNQIRSWNVFTNREYFLQGLISSHNSESEVNSDSSTVNVLFSWSCSGVAIREINNSKDLQYCVTFKFANIGSAL